jgi:iron complex outermembrane receptor protein
MPTSGNTFSKTTYKISARWLPVKEVLVRGSYGTGFRAPAMTDIAGALVFAGSTTGSYACPFPGHRRLSARQRAVRSAGGSERPLRRNGLKPETSKQWTAGARWDPIKGLSIGADLWNVEIKNQVLSQGIAEQVGFQNPQQYASLFVNPYARPAGFTTIAFSQLPFNGGTAKYQGIDYDVDLLDADVVGSLHREPDGHAHAEGEIHLRPGPSRSTPTSESSGPTSRSCSGITFQVIMSLQTGPWTNTLTAHYKSGYEDAAYGANETIFLANPDGSPRSSPSRSPECGCRRTRRGIGRRSTTSARTSEARSASSTCSIATRRARCRPAAAETRSAMTAGTPTRSAAIYGRIGVKF